MRMRLFQIAVRLIAKSDSPVEYHGKSLQRTEVMGDLGAESTGRSSADNPMARSL